MGADLVADRFSFRLFDTAVSTASGYAKFPKSRALDPNMIAIKLVPEISRRRLPNSRKFEELPMSWSVTAASIAGFAGAFELYPVKGTRGYRA